MFLRAARRIALGPARARDGREKNLFQKASFVLHYLENCVQIVVSSFLNMYVLKFSWREA
jgi:hypothetical protein